MGGLLAELESKQSQSTFAGRVGVGVASKEGGEHAKVKEKHSPSGEGVPQSVLDVDDVKTARMFLTVGDGAHSPQVVATSHHGQVAWTQSELHCQRSYTKMQQAVTIIKLHKSVKWRHQK